MNAKIDKNTLTLSFENISELVAKAQPSKSGKSNMVYTTSGFMALPINGPSGKPVRVSINIIA